MKTTSANRGANVGRAGNMGRTSKTAAHERNVPEPVWLSPGGLSVCSGRNPRTSSVAADKNHLNLLVHAEGQVQRGVGSLDPREALRCSPSPWSTLKMQQETQMVECNRIRLFPLPSVLLRPPCSAPALICPPRGGDHGTATAPLNEIFSFRPHFSRLPSLPLG